MLAPEFTKSGHLQVAEARGGKEVWRRGSWQSLYLHGKHIFIHCSRRKYFVHAENIPQPLKKGHIVLLFLLCCENICHTENF